MNCSNENNTIINQYYTTIIIGLFKYRNKKFKSQKLFTNTLFNIIKKSYQPDFIECHIIVCIFSKIFKDLKFKETKHDFNKLYSLKSRQYAIIKLIPPIDDYHYLLLIPDNNNFIIYSAYGSKYIKPYSIHKKTFQKYYNEYMKAKNGNNNDLLKYNKNIQNIGIVQLWKKLTKYDTSITFNEMVKNFDENNDEEDWNDLMDYFKEKDKYFKHEIIIYESIKKNK